MADQTLSKQEYLTKLPATVPTGLVLVQNSARPAKRLGTRGFRAWLDQPSGAMSPVLAAGRGNSARIIVSIASHGTLHDQRGVAP